MEMKIAIRVDAVQVLMITRCLQRQAAEARLAGPAVWPQGCGLPVVWSAGGLAHPAEMSSGGAGGEAAGAAGASAHGGAAAGNAARRLRPDGG